MHLQSKQGNIRTSLGKEISSFYIHQTPEWWQFNRSHFFDAEEDCLFLLEICTTNYLQTAQRNKKTKQRSPRLSEKEIDIKEALREQNQKLESDLKPNGPLSLSPGV